MFNQLTCKLIELVDRKKLSAHYLCQKHWQLQISEWNDPKPYQTTWWLNQCDEQKAQIWLGECIAWIGVRESEQKEKRIVK